MATVVLTPEQMAGDADVPEKDLRRLFRPVLRDRDTDFDMGQWVLAETIRRLREADPEGNKKTIRRLRLLRAIGAGGIFLRIVSRISGISVEDGDWLAFLKAIVEWLMSEEGQAFIEMIIEIVMLILSLV